MLSVDPLADHPNQIDKSPYAYVWNNPTLLTDPDGRCPKCPYPVRQALAELEAQVNGVVDEVSGFFYSTGEVLETSGDVVEKVGDVITAAGTVVTPVAPEIGIPMAATGKTIATTGFVMSTAGKLLQAKNAEAATSALAELAPGVIAAPLKKQAKKVITGGSSDPQRNVEAQMIEELFNPVEYGMEQMISEELDKVISDDAADKDCKED